MACPHESELVELVERIAPRERVDALERHIDECSECRRVVAELARTDTRAGVPEPAVAPGERVPAELVRDYLRADAVHRESIVARAIVFVSAFSFVTLGLYTPFHGSPMIVPTFATQSVTLLYAIAVTIALRRGWYHPALPFVATIVEVSMLFAIHFAVLASMGQEAAMGSPGAALAAAAVVFSAIRADPRVCLVAGVVASVEFMIVHAAVQELAPDAGAPPGVAVFAGTFYLLPGLAGAALARYLVGRAEGALRAVRERDLFGKYLVHESLGHGGMGEVFRATYCPEGGFTKTVAIKRVRDDIADDERRIAAFREEARTAARLAHPNLVQVLDFGRFHGSYMVAMEFVDGVSLATLLRRHGVLEPAAVVYLGAELAAGLAHLHERTDVDGSPLGLVHCDVNPPNVLLSSIGEVKLADFGVVRAQHVAEPRRTFSGKPAYAAPEQLRGDPLDARADLFALGLTMIEALTGRRALSDGDPLPAELWALLSALVDPDPARRPASAARVRSELLKVAGVLAPYPRGAGLVARAVGEARGDAKSSDRPRQPDRDDPTQAATHS